MNALPEKPAVLLLQFFVDLFQETQREPGVLEGLNLQSTNIREFTYVDDTVYRAIQSEWDGIYQRSPLRTVDDGMDLHRNYHNSQTMWTFTAPNIGDLLQRMKYFDTRDMVSWTFNDVDTLTLYMDDEGLHKTVFCLSIIVGNMRATLPPEAEISVYYRPEAWAMGQHMSERAQCDFRTISSSPVLNKRLGRLLKGQSGAPRACIRVHMKGLTETSLLTSNTVISDILSASMRIERVGPLQSDLIAVATEIIRQHLSQPEFSIDTLARELGVSRRTLQRRLKDQALTFNQLLRQERKRKAVELINSGEHDRSRIVEMVGYRELSSLYRLIRPS